MRLGNFNAGYDRIVTGLETLEKKGYSLKFSTSGLTSELNAVKLQVESLTSAVGVAIGKLRDLGEVNLRFSSLRAATQDAQADLGAVGLAAKGTKEELAGLNGVKFAAPDTAPVLAGLKEVSAQAKLTAKEIADAYKGVGAVPLPASPRLPVPPPPRRSTIDPRVAAENRQQRDEGFNIRQNKAIDKKRDDMAGRAADGLTLAGAGAVGLAGYVAVKAGDWQKVLLDMKSNTLMTPQDFGLFKRLIPQMASESGADMTALANAFKRAENHDFTGQNAVKLETAAMQSAVATSSDPEATANLLAQQMFAFHVDPSKSKNAMNMIHVAANRGNLDMGEFVQNAGYGINSLAALSKDKFGQDAGLGMRDALAAYSTATKYGFNPSEAATQIRDLGVHLIKPTPQTLKILAALKASGRGDLRSDFSLKGLQTKGLHGILEDLAKATEGHPEIVMQALGAQRGGIGAMILGQGGYYNGKKVNAGRGLDTFRDIYAQLGQAEAGKLDPITPLYQERRGTVNSKMAQTENKLQADIVKLGDDGALDALGHFFDRLGAVLDKFGKLPKKTQTGIFDALLYGGAGAVAVDGGIKGLLWIKGLKADLAELGGVKVPVGLSNALKGIGGFFARLSGMSLSGGALGLLARIGLISGGGSGLVNAGGLGGGLLRGGAGLGAGLIGGGILAAPAMVLAYGLKKITEQHNAVNDARAHMAGMVDVSPFVREKSALRHQLQKDPGDKAAAHKLRIVTDEMNRILGTYNRHFAAAQGKLGAYPAFLTSMLAKAGAHLSGGIYQCGSAITAAYQSAGLGTSATQTRNNGKRQGAIGTDRNGNPMYPNGTEVFLPPNNGKLDVKGTNQHFVLTWVGGDGVQRVAENTTAGGGGYHYRGDRTLADLVAAHGGRMEAFLAGSGAGRPDNPRYASHRHTRTEQVPQGEQTHSHDGGKHHSDGDWYSTFHAMTDPEAVAASKAAHKAEEKTRRESAAQKRKAEAQKKRDASFDKTQSEKEFGETHGGKYDRLRHLARADVPNNIRLFEHQGVSPAAARVKAEGVAAGQIKAINAEEATHLADLQKKKATAAETAANRQTAAEAREAKTQEKQWDDSVKAAKSAIGKIAKEHEMAAKHKAADDKRAAADAKRVSDEELRAAKRLAEEEKRAQDEVMQFEFQHHKITLQNYLGYLNTRLTAAQAAATAEGKLANEDVIGLTTKKEELEATQSPTRENINVREGMRDGFQSSTEGALRNWKNPRTAAKSVAHDMKSHMADMGASLGSKWLTGQIFGGGLGLSGGLGGPGKLFGGLGNLFGGLFGHKKGAAGASGILGALGGGAGVPSGVTPVYVVNMGNGFGGAGGSFGTGGMSGFGGGASGALSMAGNVASLFSKGGAGGGLGGLLGKGGGLSGLLGHGGGMLSGLGAAMPWVSGGLMLNGVLGNPLGKAFKGFKKLFHFSSGAWSVPGSGTGDNVPAMLAPGELAMPRPAAQAFRDYFKGGGRGQGAGFGAQPGHGPVTVTVNHHGDINNHAEGERFHEQTAWHVKSALPVATPGT